MHVVAVPSPGLLADVVLHLPSEVSNATAPVLRERFDEVVRVGAGPITLDCVAVSFIDAAGLGALVHLVKGASAEQRSVTLCNVSPWVIRVITFGGLAASLLGVDESVAAAPFAIA